MVVLNDCYQRNSVKHLRDQYCIEWAADPLHILYAFYAEGKPSETA